MKSWIKHKLKRCSVSDCWAKATEVITWASTGPVPLCERCADNLTLLCYEPIVHEDPIGKKDKP